MSGVGDASRGFTLPATSTPADSTFGNAGVAPGVAQSTTSSAFSLGAGDPGAAKTSQPTLFSLTPSAKSTAPTSSITLSTSNTPSATSSQPGLSFGIGALTATTATFSVSTSTPSATAASATPAPAAPNFGIGTSFGTGSSTAATTSAPSFAGRTLSFPQSAASTTFPASLTSTSSLTTATTGQTTLGTSTTVTDSSAVNSSSVNFCQLEEAINKWTLELEEQEKSFMNQALQVNSWDRLLIANGEKIINLNDAVEQVKLEQKQLDHELDYILAQQRELEDLLNPLEKELETNGVSDPERESTYKLAEDIDIQLKHMSEDLKEIVEHINETNQTQDNSDPIVQISRILNAHMNSLQWIDQNTTIIASHLEQVSKLQAVHRRETERSFHRTYD